MLLFAREYDGYQRKPHFHLLILLNGNAIRGTGKWDLLCDNLYSRLYEAWAFALGMRAYEIEGLIQFANGSALTSRGRNFVRYGSMLLERGDEEMFHDLFWTSSYLAKVATKTFMMAAVLSFLHVLSSRTGKFRCSLLLWLNCTEQDAQ